jgi:Fe2+ transport system protein FeoA
LTLTDLAKGQRATVVSMSPETELRLFGFGLFPGVELELLQRYPSFIIRCERTEIALERSVALQVQVQPVTGEERA